MQFTLEPDIEYIAKECKYDPPHTHTWPADWKFGGANGEHPGADARFFPDSYTYFDERLQVIMVTSAPLCDEQAIDEFSIVARGGERPKWAQVRRWNDRENSITLPVEYDADTDEVWDKE